MSENAMAKLGTAVVSRLKDVSLPTLRREETIDPERMRSVMAWYAAVEAPRRDESAPRVPARA